MKNQWVPPELCTLDWDSKLVDSLNNPNVHEESLAMLVGSEDSIKVLGVPAYKSGTNRKAGQIISELT